MDNFYSQFPLLPDPITTGLSDVEGESFPDLDVTPLSPPRLLAPRIGTPPLITPSSAHPHNQYKDPLTAGQPNLVNPANGGAIPGHENSPEELQEAEDPVSFHDENIDALLQQEMPSEFFDQVEAMLHNKGLGEETEQEGQDQAEPSATSQLPGDSNYSINFHSETQLGQFSYQTFVVRNPPECHECTERTLFPSPEHLQEHIRKKHAPKPKKRKYTKRQKVPKKEHICDVCKDKFVSATNLRRHKFVVHKNIAYNCRYCAAYFSSRNPYVTHMRNAHNVIPASVLKRFGPDAYEKRNQKKKVDALRRSGWTVHMCSSCSTWSEVKGNITRHVNNFHGKIAKFTCDVRGCGRKFKTKSNLQQHMGSRHADHKLTNGQENGQP